MSHDMKTMLSDKRVKFSYFDVFETDYATPGRTSTMNVVRVFFVFANYMEFAQFYIAVWSVVWSTAIAAFCRLDTDSWWPQPWTAIELAWT